MRIYLFLFILSVLFACETKQNSTEGVPVSEEEQDNEIIIEVLKDKTGLRVPGIGWTVRIPEKWKKTWKEQIYRINTPMRKEAGKEIAIQLENTQTIELINIRKNRVNSFSATIEPFDEITNDSYDDHIISMHNFLKNAYTNKNIYIEYQIAARRIDGLMFDIFDLTIYSPNKTRVIFYQSFFSCLINGYDFTMTVNYNNERDKDTLMDIVHSSKFSVKK